MAALVDLADNWIGYTRHEMTPYPAGESRPTAMAISYPVSYARSINGILPWAV